MEAERTAFRQVVVEAIRMNGIAQNVCKGKAS